VVGSLVLGASALWLASKQVWSWSTAHSILHGTVVNAVDGAQAQPALVALAVLAIAAVAATFAIAGWSRRILGGLVVLAGIAALLAGVLDLSAVFGEHPDGYPTWQILFGHLLAIVAGLLLGCGGLVMVRAANQMPRLGASYEAPVGAGATSRRKRDPDAEMWRALSEGDDPTAND
jgi:hypothetical protein